MMLSSLNVDLAAIARNYLYLKNKLGNGTDCAAVVKADAYGLGAAAVAPALYAQNCRHFFVAHTSEAFDLPQLGESGKTDAAIYILNGLTGSDPREIAAKGFVPVLNTLTDIETWATVAAGKPAVLHIDTGMNRLGLGGRDVEELSTRKDLLQKIDLRYVMSHLACADESSHPKNAAQLKAFRTLSAALDRPCRLSLANSSGIFLGVDYHFDLVRPGCALYGINPVEDGNPMQGVITLKARILQVREIKESSTVGYGATYTINPPALTATISVGYADGYLRSLTGHGRVCVNGVRRPIVGRVSMDTIVVDITGMADIKQGDWVELIGEHLPVDAVAKSAGTIGYEILTNLGNRYHRVYTN